MAAPTPMNPRLRAEEAETFCSEAARVARGGARGAGLAVWLGAVRTEGRGGWGERHKRSPLARRCRRRQDAGGAESRSAWHRKTRTERSNPNKMLGSPAETGLDRAERQTGRRIRSGVGRARCTQEQPHPSQTADRSPSPAPPRR